MTSLHWHITGAVDHLRRYNAQWFRRSYLLQRFPCCAAEVYDVLYYAGVLRRRGNDDEDPEMQWMLPVARDLHWVVSHEGTKQIRTECYGRREAILLLLQHKDIDAYVWTPQCTAITRRDARRELEKL